MSVVGGEGGGFRVLVDVDGDVDVDEFGWGGNGGMVLNRTPVETVL